MTDTKREYLKTWAKKAGIRAIKTVAQTAVATIGTAAAMGQVDWLTSVAGIPEAPKETE